MCQAVFANECLEVIGDELRAIVADDSMCHSEVLFSPFGNDHFDVKFLHRLTQFPVDDVATESIEHRDQEVKRPTRVDVADVNMPILVDFRWLDEACNLLAGGGHFCGPNAQRS